MIQVQYCKNIIYFGLLTHSSSRNVCVLVFRRVLIKNSHQNKCYYNDNIISVLAKQCQYIYNNINNNNNTIILQ